MVSMLAEVADSAFCVTPDNPRALDGCDYAAEFCGQGIAARAFDTMDAALSAAYSYCRERNIPLVALGSLYMYADFCAALERIIK